MRLAGEGRATGRVCGSLGPDPSWRRRPGTCKRCDRGQASIEFALVLPLVLLVLLGLLQVGVYVLEKLEVTGAAREGAREAAVTADRDRIEQAAERSAPGLDIEVQVERGTVRGDPAVVAVSARPTQLPFMGGIVAELKLESSATMRVESVEGEP